MNLPDYLTPLPYRVSWLTGSHMHGTAGPDSDEDWTHVFWCPDDDRRVFRQLPEVWHSKGNDDKAYSLRKYAELLVKGNPNVIELLAHAPTDWAARQAWWKGFAETVSPHVHTRAYFSSIRGHIMGVLKETAPDGKRIAHGLRLALLGLEDLGTPGLLATQLERVRDVKFGVVPPFVGLELLAERDKELGALLAERPLPDAEALKEAVNGWFLRN